MSFRFTIGKKIGTGFGVLILFIIVVFGATFFAVNNGIKTFRENDNTSNELIQVLTPSKEKVTKLRILVNESKLLAIQWVDHQGRNDTPDKIRLSNLMQQNIPSTRDEIIALSANWKDEHDVLVLNNAIGKIDTLFAFYEEVMMLLPDIASYDDPLFSLQARFFVLQDGDIPVLAGKIDQNLLTLQNSLERKEADALELVKNSSEKAKKRFQSLTIFWILGAALIILAVVIAAFTTNSIVKPVRSLRSILLSLGKGIFPDTKIVIRNDEIGDMSQAMIELVDGLQRTTDFANQVGQSNFSYPYEPLSDEDVLGHALLKMKDELAETERILEQKVKERTEEVVKQKDEIESQNKKLEELYKDVTDSIRYAKRLQYSILPPEEKVKTICPNSFVLFKPKDIVSGDFYWFDQLNGKSYCAAVDCTGHGVPGAFMSLVGANGLNAAVREHHTDKPGSIIDELNSFVAETLNKTREDNDVRDGMDLSLISIDYKTLQLEFAGAYNPIYIIRNEEFIILPADKFAIGSFDPGTKNYNNQLFQLEKGDQIYMFSDGYADQFGGDKGKKFLYKTFREELLRVHLLSPDEQRKELNKTIVNWQGDYAQVDDILVIGIRI
ncbi:SpoIIE family protein phosphatase [Paracrocinitomix mangrovi]|uniref:SpoIIE family protein phosphatase n=1 Tax=Paracrocinitomix mangrovi TaxID=2862509 RepID=UPI001C8EE4C0|nr:SpoIIE family protein phosphatase [Paracrocinitomix mangrovi]UKN00539.1 SpoIIE family protein phosphatase [Paracrocinitomix mangrovi]